MIIVADGDVDRGSTELVRSMEVEDKAIVFSVAVGNEAQAAAGRVCVAPRRAEDLKNLATQAQLYFKARKFNENSLKCIKMDRKSHEKRRTRGIRCRSRATTASRRSWTTSRSTAAKWSSRPRFGR